MANLIEDGWLHLTNGSDSMKLACRTIKWDTVFDPTIDHYEGKISFGYDLGVDWQVIKVGGIIFSSESDLTIFNLKLRAWQFAGTLALRVQRKAAGDFEKIDGVHTYYPVLSKGTADATKIEAEDGEHYEVGKLQFELAGIAS